MIRKKFAIPILLVLGLIIGGLWLAGPALKWGMVKGIQSATRSEVNIDDVSVRYFPIRVSVTGLQVSNPKYLNWNLVSLDSADTQVEFLPLLKKKLIIDTIKIQELNVHTKRTQKAQYFPKKEKKKGPSALGKMSKKVADTVFTKDNLLDVTLPEISMEQLTHTNATVAALESEYKAIEATFSDENTQKYKKDLAQIKKLVSSLLNLKINDLEDLNQAKSDYNTLKKKIDTVQNTLDAEYKTAKGKINTFGKNIGGLERAAEKDFNEISKQVSGGTFNSASITDKLLNEPFRDTLDKSQKYVDFGIKVKKKVASPKKPKREYKRLDGEDIHFGVETELPSLLVRKIDGTGANSEIHVRNFGSENQNPDYPLSGDLLIRKIPVADLEVFNDGIKEIQLDSGNLKVQANLDTRAKIHYLDFRVDLSQGKFSSRGFDSSNIVEKLIQSGLRKTSKLDLKGNYDTGRNKLTLNSSFDEQVKKALEDAVNKEIAKVKAQIQDEINKQLAPVLSQFEGLKAEDLAKLETWEKGLESQLDEYQNKAEKKYKKQEKKVKKKLQKEADKALEGVGDDIKNALKGLKF